MARVLKWLVIIGAVLLTLFAAAYVYFYVWALIVFNRSDRVLSNVRIELGEKRIWQGDLAPHGSRYLFGTPIRSGEALAFYEIDGEQIVAHCGYVGGGPMAKSVRFTLNVEGYSCDVFDRPLP